MLIKVDEEIYDEDGNPYHDDIVIADWKEINGDILSDIAQSLDSLGIDVIEYKTYSDYYAFRFVKKSEEPKPNDNSDKGFPVKVSADSRWPLVCNNNCPFERDCANASSAGDFRTETGLTPDFVKNKDGSITCYGCGELSRGMRVFKKDGNPSTYHDEYWK